MIHPCRMHNHQLQVICWASRLSGIPTWSGFSPISSFKCAVLNCFLFLSPLTPSRAGPASLQSFSDTENSRPIHFILKLQSHHQLTTDLPAPTDSWASGGGICIGGEQSFFSFFCPFLSFSSFSQVTERDCGKEPRLFDYFIPRLPLCFLPCLSMIAVWLATKCSFPLVCVSRSLGSIGRNIFNAEFLDLSAG